MSCSSRREIGRWLPDRRGQTEPIAALVAVLAIAIGLGLYAGVAAEQSPEQDGTDAEATMQRVSEELLADGIFANNESLDPEQFERPGETVAFEISLEYGVWSIGPRAPPDADTATRPVTVQMANGQYPAQLTVEVWES